MRRQGWGGRYLVDGFPRSLENYDVWQSILGDKVNVKFTFLLECSESVMEERLINRGKTSGRSDDNIETIRKRFVTFKEETMPVLDVLANQIVTKKVNSDPGIENVWGEVETAFGAPISVGPDVVFVLGGHGAGKGTFSAKICEQFGYKTLSAGDLIRAERARPGSKTAELIETRLKEGKLIPSEITVGLIEEEMRRQGWGVRYLVDGFPRSVE